MATARAEVSEDSTVQVRQSLTLLACCLLSLLRGAIAEGQVYQRYGSAWQMPQSSPVWQSPAHQHPSPGHGDGGHGHGPGNHSQEPGQGPVAQGPAAQGPSGGSGGWFQRPYPYHLDYYRMRYGGSYAPYFGNYNAPQPVIVPPYNNYYGGYGNGYGGYAPWGNSYGAPAGPVPYATEQWVEPVAE